MGKGRRQRTRREQVAGSDLGSSVAVDESYPFEVDDLTRRKLGANGLAELADNLWAKDCQTCGWDLAGDRPTVHCQDMFTFTQVTLHHRRCQPARWSEDTLIQASNAALVSYDVLSFMLPGQAVSADGTTRSREDRPMFFVNPSLESLMLVEKGHGWTNLLPETFHHAGLRPPGPEMSLRDPIPRATAQLGVGEVSVNLSPIDLWSCGVDVAFREAVEDLGGVLLAVTSAMVPSRMNTLGEFIDLFSTNRIALGWVQLTRDQQR